METEPNNPTLEKILAHQSLDKKLGDRSFRDIIRSEIDAGTIRLNASGKLDLVDPELQVVHWAIVTNGYSLAGPCRFAKWFLFNVVYQKQAIPVACRNCYKIKMKPKTLRDLKRLYDVAGDFPCATKWGPEFDYPYSKDLYGGYLYAIGLDHAYELFEFAQTKLEADFGSKDEFNPVIKRGCTEYEFAMGASDKWEIKEDLSEVEEYLFSVFESVTEPDCTGPRFHATFFNWLHEAFMIGDESYRDFTGGKELLPPIVDYSKK